MGNKNFHIQIELKIKKNRWACLRIAQICSTMELKDWYSTLAIIVAFGTLTITVLSYRRNRRIDSENLLFKYKSEGYALLLEKLATIMDKILDEQKFLDNLNLKDSNEVRKELANRIESFELMICEFANDVIKHSLFFSKEINSELDAFSNFLYDTQDNQSNQSIEDIRKEMDNYYNDFLLKADHLFDLMRNDLHVDQLNTSLSKRLKGIGR
jgi:hypothetical protein